MLTDNDILVSRLRILPALMCVQRKAQKRIVTEADFIQANIDSFGDDIGKTTNWITSMFDVQAMFPKDSPQYIELDYRIKCGQLFQQNKRATTQMFTFTARCPKRNLSNCWKPLKLNSPQRNHERGKRDGSESRKRIEIAHG